MNPDTLFKISLVGMWIGVVLQCIGGICKLSPFVSTTTLIVLSVITGAVLIVTALFVYKAMKRL